MKHCIAVFLLLTFGQAIYGQNEGELANFYLGVSYGTSYPVGNFQDTDISNPDAGFAKNGTKLDIYGGKFLNPKVTLTGVFRYQSFETEIEDLIATFNDENPGTDFTGSTEDWEAYYFLVGVAYKVVVNRKINFFPRFGLGPLIANNPGINISSPNSTITNNFSRSSETGWGLGFELGIGLQTNLGKHFALMPTFAFSGGLVTIPDVVTTTDNIIVISDYQPVIRSFNLGLSLAYRFY
ncbi:MAG: outer membrane beta-barrel protein [Bacteroidota bacterium]